MKRRTLLAIMFAAASWPSLADDDDGDDSGDDDSDDSGDDDSDDDSSDDSDDDGGSDDDEADDDLDDHNDALNAVETRGVLELETLLKHFRSQFSGRVVDITLLERSAGLAFRVTYVDRAGRVRKVLLNAQTGAVTN